MKNNIYYPIQIPYIFSKDFFENLKYTEETVPTLHNFLICFWSMHPITHKKITVDNIIIADGCIDLVVDFDAKQIGYTGMSQTNFNFEINLPNNYIGARLKPGAFHAMTGLSAAAAMDNFLPLASIDKDFDPDTFFALPQERAENFFKTYIKVLASITSPNPLSKFFDELSINIPESTTVLCERLNISTSTCQRLFRRNFGLSPKLVLSILRFQKSLHLLTTTQKTDEILNQTSYYDQPHFINDFKKNIGLTPQELIQKYKS